MSTFRRVLVGWDGSKDAAHALRLAGDLVDDLHGDVVVITVVRPPAHAETAGEREREVEAIRRSALADLRSTARAARTATAPSHVVVEARDTADALCRYSFEHGFDLLFVGRHGVDAAVHPRIGGVTERLIRQSSCPVAVVGST